MDTQSQLNQQDMTILTTVQEILKEAGYNPTNLGNRHNHPGYHILELIKPGYYLRIYQEQTTPHILLIPNRYGKSIHLDLQDPESIPKLLKLIKEPERWTSQNQIQF